MSNKQANSPGLFDALNLFRRRFRYVVFGTLLGTVAAGAYFWVLVPTFQATGAFLVDLPENLPGRSGEPTAEGSSISDEVMADQVSILESPAVIASALEEVSQEVLESVRNSLEDDQDEVEYITEHLRVTRGGEGQRRNARVITVRLRHNDPEHCADIVKSIIANYGRFNSEKSGETGDQSIETIQGKLDIAKSELDAVSDAYDDFRDSHPELIGHQVDRINPYQVEVKTCIDKLAEIRTLKDETEYRYGAVRKLLSRKSVDEDGFERLELLQKISGKTVRPETIEAAKAEVNELWQMILREKDLLAQYGEGHPLVRRNRAGIQGMKELLAQKRRQREKGIALSLVSDLHELKRRDASEKACLTKALDSARELGEAAREDAKMWTMVEHKRRIYDMWSDRFDEAIIGKSHGTIITKTLASVESGEPITPNPVLILALGTMVGLFMGLGLAVVVDHLDAGAVHEAEIQVARHPRVMNDSKLHHVRPNVGAAV